MSRVPARGDYRYFDNVARDQELRNMRRRVAELENGEAIAHKKKRADKWRAQYEREGASQKKDAAAADRERRKTLRLWQDVNTDLSDENDMKQREWTS